ncbi:Latrophilin-3 [Trichinella spiralis]|uniref:Latrophilin-3 n=2 Tax=Trichinella spiralis TaxID=6334 RepID=A0A0V1BS53_TRISP|nr:Latrophilin-3 [Trichinella spiralis]
MDPAYHHFYFLHHCHFAYCLCVQDFLQRQLAERNSKSEREKETAHRTLTMIHVLAQRSLADHCFKRFGRLQALVKRMCAMKRIHFTLASFYGWLCLLGANCFDDVVKFACERRANENLFDLTSPARIAISEVGCNSGAWCRPCPNAPGGQWSAGAFHLSAVADSACQTHQTQVRGGPCDWSTVEPPPSPSVVGPVRPKLAGHQLGKLICVGVGDHNRRPARTFDEAKYSLHFVIKFQPIRSLSICGFAYFSLHSVSLVAMVQTTKQLTQYACEGDMLTLSCPPMQLIRIVRANYGRFSLNVCNEDGHDWPNTQCMDPNSTGVLADRCNEKRNCSVSANGRIFKDRCPDTSKYLEVIYECSPEADSEMTHEEYAEMRCDLNGFWVFSKADLSKCTSSWTKPIKLALTDLTRANESFMEVQRALRRGTRHHDLFGGDLIEVGTFLTGMVEGASKLYRKNPLHQQRRIYTDLVKTVVDTVSNVLQNGQTAAWNDLNERKCKQVSNKLIEGVEKSAMLLATTMSPRSGIEAISSPHIMIEISIVSVQNYIQFPSRSLYDPKTDSVQLPRSALQGRADDDWSKVIFVTYDAIGKRMKPDARLDRPEIQRVVASKVVSTVVNMDTAIRGLREPVIITFWVPNQENMSNPSCVFWDKSVIMNGVIGEWSTQGCSLLHHNKSHIVCRCNHLTSFAVLMDVHGVDVPAEDLATLSIITYIGCAVSVICLFATLISFFMFRSLQCERITIHKNLCLCLLIAEVVFLFGIRQTSNPLTCGIIAVVLHFFFLAAFAWMLLEGFQLYSLLVDVFQPERNRGKFYYAFAYGLPLVIVAVSLGVDYSKYGTEEYCWLSTEEYFILSFVGPVAFVLCMNFVFLLVSILIVFRHSPYSKSQSPRHGQTMAVNTRFKMWLKGSVMLVILLGLTWSLGFLFVNHSTLFIAYAFTVLNSLQGVFIFVFQVLMHKKVRKEWNNWARKHFLSKRWSATRRDYGYNPVGSVNTSKMIKAYVDIYPRSTGFLTTAPNMYSQNTSRSPVLYSSRHLTSESHLEYASAIAPDLIVPAESSSGKCHYAVYTPKYAMGTTYLPSHSRLTTQEPSHKPPPRFPPPIPPVEYCSNSICTDNTYLCTFGIPRRREELDSGYGESDATVSKQISSKSQTGEGDRPVSPVDSPCMACSSKSASEWSYEIPISSPQRTSFPGCQCSGMATPYQTTAISAILKKP